MKLKYRFCNNPAPQFGGICMPECDTENISYQICDPINGEWSDWSTSEDSECQENDTNVWKKPQIRYCNSPNPEFGGNDCLIDDGGIGMNYECYFLDKKLIV